MDKQKAKAIRESVKLLRELTGELKETAWRVMDILDTLADESEQLRLAAINADDAQSALVSVEYLFKEAEKNIRRYEKYAAC